MIAPLSEMMKLRSREIKLTSTIWGFVNLPNATPQISVVSFHVGVLNLCTILGDCSK